MALLQSTVTLSTAAVQASTTSVPCHYLRVESEASNAAVQYGISTVSSTVYAGTILANTSTINNAVIIGPFDMLPLDLSELYFLGTNGQKIHLTIIA